MPARHNTSVVLRAVALACALVLGGAAGDAGAHTAPVHVAYDEFLDTPCPYDPVNSAGCAYDMLLDKPAIFVADSDDEWTRQHERGHIYDYTSLTDTYRAQFKRLFGFAGSWAGGWLEASPAEWWAEAYARCALHVPTGQPSAYDYNPTRAEHRAACRLIWNADRDRRT